jgi:hypothetical protein
MAPKELNFITGNKNKLAEVQAILSETPVKLQSQAVDLVEIQGTIEEISTDKARRAAEAVCEPIVFVELSSFYSLNNFNMENFNANKWAMTRSEDRFWLKIRAYVSMLLMSCLDLMCTLF